MYKTFFCLAAIIIVNKPVFAQNMHGQLVRSSKGVNMLTINELEITKFSTIHFFTPLPASQATFSYKKFHPTVTYPRFYLDIFSKTSRPIPMDFYLSKLGWVCKQEWRFEKKAGIPLRIRLGSAAQVDYLEGK